MKNVNEIKAEAKEQIMKVLDMCNCYKYTEKGIDLWLDTWEKACSPQIEAIAEKSPYYDGKCKVVFPAEYPREINVDGIINFSNWLYDYASRNLTPAKVNGFTKKEAYEMYNFYKSLKTITNRLGDINTELLPTEMKKICNMLSKTCTEENSDFVKNTRECAVAYEAFALERGIRNFHNEAYFSEDIENSGVKRAEILSQILAKSCARTQFLNEELVEDFSYYFGRCRFSVGQKLSRAVNRIASAYGLNQDPEWNKEFAKYADSINPLTVTKWTVLSWHPMDYLTFCFGNSWSTCSNIDKHNVRGIKIGSSRSSITNYVNEDYVFRGEHSAAALSYMFDKTSFIFYTVNHKYDGNHYEEQDKESRIVFSLNEDMDTLLQSRLYPQCNDDNRTDESYRIPREIVQKVIADALEKPNLWKMKKGYSICREYALSTGVHYPDYTDERNGNCNISWMGEEPKVIHLGHDAICPKCLETHTYTGSLNCRDCDPEY